MDDVAFVSWMRDHAVAGPLIFVLVRVASVVISPIPGIAVDAPGIAIFGWQAALVYAEIGILVGAGICFAMARKFREPLLQRVGFLRHVQYWQSRLSEREEFWVWVGLRLTTNPAFDYLSYAAGLTTSRFGMFMLSTFLGSLPSMIIVFMLGGQIAKRGYPFAILVVGVVILLIVLLRRRLLGSRTKLRDTQSMR